MINKEKQINSSLIRTMAKDMAVLGKRGLPPISLPVQKVELKALPKVPPKTPDIPKAKAVYEESRPVFVIVGLIGILIIGGLGGFFYWWNYLRIAPVVTHYECQDNQCVDVEGEGDNQCQLDVDCQSIEPIEPIIPQALIPIDETETIELVAGQEGLLLGQLGLIIAENQAINIVKRILIKVVDQQDKKYIDLNNLALALDIDIPEKILSAVADDYTLFLYSQPEGNRLGIVMNIGESDTLVQDLTSWEITIADDLKSLFFKDQLPIAFTEEFQDNVYQEIAIRYLNFPDPGLSIDYSIVSGKLLITTSRESMFAVIKSLLEVDSD